MKKFVLHEVKKFVLHCLHAGTHLQCSKGSMRRSRVRCTAHKPLVPGPAQVVASIHQPRSSIFEKLDDLVREEDTLIERCCDSAFFWVPL